MQEISWTKRLIILALAFALYLFTWNLAFAEGQSPVFLRGNLNKELLESSSKQLDAYSASEPITLVINSNFGDLLATLDFAKKIYTQKKDKGQSVIVYIEDNAIGPAAVLPFLADEIKISPFVSWGDIALGNEKIYRANILRNKVESLIDPEEEKAALLYLLASAMSDPSIRLVDDNGWRLARNDLEKGQAAISPEGQALVLNQNQLKQLGLVHEVIAPEAFPTNATTSKNESKPLEGEPISTTALEAELKRRIIYSPDGSNPVGHILIDDRTNGINQSTWLYVKKALDYYKEKKPIFIILELNTPGGEVYPAQLISDALKEMDTQYNIPVVAYINNWAISAGAMLAYSSRFIVTVKDGSMGAAEPLTQNAEGKMETASEKINSALRADFANRARFFGRNPYIAEAMVDKQMILVRRYGQVIKLDSESQIRSDGPSPDIVISQKGKLLTLDAEQMIEDGVADLLIPPTRTDPITQEERAAGRWPASKEPLFHQPFFDKIPNATIDSYQMDWKMRFFVLLASPAVSSLLLLGLMLGLYMEMSTPGFGVPGTIALTCLFLIILSSFSLEVANWLELILLLVGLAVILVEVFVLPTFGLLGFIGLLLFIGGLFGMMLPGIENISYEIDTQSLNAAGEAFFVRLAWLCGTLVAGFIIMLLLARFITPSQLFFKRLVLHGNEQVGYSAVDEASTFPAEGSQGLAETTLRPGGKVSVEGVWYDAISVGQLIEKGEPVIVIRIEGGNLIVAPYSNNHFRGNEP